MRVIHDNEFQEETDDRDQDSQRRSDAARTLAELLVRAKACHGGAGTPTDAEEWFGAESESLLRWADETGRLLSSSEFGELIKGFKVLEGGLEHRVYYVRRTGRVFKVTKPPYFGAMWDLWKYVQNLIWCNEVFNDDLRIEGVIETSEGVSLVISQPYIHGNMPDGEQVSEWFQRQGYKQLSTLVWEGDGGRRIGDVYERNLILRNDGVMIPIDLHVERLSESERL